MSLRFCAERKVAHTKSCSLPSECTSVETVRVPAAECCVKCHENAEMAFKGNVVIELCVCVYNVYVGVCVCIYI